MKETILGVPIGPHWLGLLVALVFTTEYARLALASDAWGRETMVLVGWVILLIGAVWTIVAARRSKEAQ